MAVTKDQVLEFLKNMSVIELADFVKELEEVFGVSAAAPVAVAAVPAAGAAAPEAVIKVVREITGLGLKEAKALVDEAPKPVKEGIAKAEAEEIAKKITEAGGTAEVK